MCQTQANKPYCACQRKPGVIDQVHQLLRSLPEAQQRLTLVSLCLQWSVRKRWHWTHYFQAPKKSKCIRSVFSKRHLLRKRSSKCQECKGMKKKTSQSVEWAMSYYSSPSYQSSHPCSLTQRVTHTCHQSLLSTATLPALTSSPQHPKPEHSRGTSRISLLEEVSKRSGSLPPKHALWGLGLSLVLLPRHSRLCQFGLQHKYCATAGSLVPIMVILQVTMRNIFLIVSGYILLRLICILEKEKFS